MDTQKYSRQVLFSPIGEAGQRKLQTSKVVVVGCGALGSAQASTLVRAGVGAIRVVDRDYVEESNLQRQSLFDETDAAQRLPKAVAAERRLKRLNADVDVEGVVTDLGWRNARELVAGFDLILDGTDNFEARYLLNDVAVKLGCPWVYGAVVGSYGVTLTVMPGRTACLACLLPEPPRGLIDTCDTAGVIAPAAAWVAAAQVTEAMKILIGREDELRGTLLAWDIWKNRIQDVRVAPNPACRVCGMGEFVYLDGRAQPQINCCGRNSVQVIPHEPRRLDLDRLRRVLESQGAVRANAYLLQFTREAYEITVFPDGRAMIKGTQDAAVARSLYARYLG